MSKPKFPITVKRGHTVVKIYRTPSRGCEAFTVVHYLGDKRLRKSFANLALAQTAAETIANKLSAGEIKVLELTGEDRLAHVRAKQFLAPTGVPLEMAAMYFARMAKLLGGDGPCNPDKLIEVAEYYLKRHPLGIEPKTVGFVRDELLKAKAGDVLDGATLE